VLAESDVDEAGHTVTAQVDAVQEAPPVMVTV